MFLVTYFKRGLGEAARAVAINLSPLCRAARASVPRSLRCYQDGADLSLLSHSSVSFSWCSSMTAPKGEKKNNFTRGNECRWSANAIRVPKYPVAIVISFSWLVLGFSPYPCHAGERMETFIQPVYCACILILTYWSLYWVVLLLPGTVHKLLQRKFPLFWCHAFMLPARWRSARRFQEWISKKLWSI